MIKELVQFTTAARKDLGQIGIQPKEGLYIQLLLEFEEGCWSLNTNKKQTAFFSKKKKDWAGDVVLKKANEVLQASWMVNTNKCFDTSPRVLAIHSCSPYVVGFKKQSLDKKVGQDSLADRLDGYFVRAKDLLGDDESEKSRLDLFKNALNSDDKLLGLIRSVEGFSEMKETEYVVIFLDESIEKYRACHDRYLNDKLFNTTDYPNPDPKGEPMGTSDFFNGFNSKKPFLLHKTAPFDIPGRITATEAKALFDFKDLLFGRRVFPNPLPIFIYENELNASVSLFKNAAEKEEKKGFADIISSMYDPKVGLANFYLLNHGGIGEIRDFDFVSRFKYELDWQVEDLFEIGYAPKITNVFQIQQDLMVEMFSNVLITKTKTGELMLKYFDDIEPNSKYFTETQRMLAMKYRRAFYDFIYKSRHEGITQTMFEDLMLTGILEDVRLDKFKDNKNTERFNICKKMNILFSLHAHFQPHKVNHLFMANQTRDLRLFMSDLAAGKETIESDEQFAFAAGQVIFYILSKSKSEDKSYARFAPFLRASEVSRFHDLIGRAYDTYSHETYPKRFGHPFSEVMGNLPDEKNLLNLRPLLLSGFFSENEFYKKAKTDNSGDES